MGKGVRTAGKRGHNLNLSLHFDPLLSLAGKAIESMDKEGSQWEQEKTEWNLQKFGCGRGRKRQAKG